MCRGVESVQEHSRFVRLWFAALLGYRWETEMQRLLTSVVPLSLQEVLIETWSALDAADFFC